MDADLNIQELIAIKKVLQASADLGRFYADLENVELVALKRSFSKKLRPSQVYKAVFKASMTVSLSPELQTIRRQLKSCDDAIP